MVASSSAVANRAGVEVLAAGGNAVDAAVAVALALGAADPGDSGLGGATYVLIRFADGQCVAVDGSAPVPMRVSRSDLLRLSEQEQDWGPELASVPASLAALDHVRRRFGTRPLAELLQPAIAIADEGYVQSPFQHASVMRYIDDVRASPSLRAIVLGDDGLPHPVGTRLRWPGLARTLRRIAEGGPELFYRGAIAQEIAADMARRGGFVTGHDLAVLRIPERTPLRGSYRDLEVITFPLPGAGGAVIEGLNILEELGPDVLDVDGAERLRVVAEALHTALLDHHRYGGHLLLPPAYRDRTHLSKEHARAVARRIADADGPLDLGREPSGSRLESQTVHVSVIDRHGNAVALTQSLGRFFGNKVVAGELGFPYNTFLGGFDPARPGSLRPRSVAPTDVAPTIVVDRDRPLLVLGSAGSSRVPGAVTSVISNVVDRRLSLADAVAAPRALWSAGRNTRGLMLEVFPPIRPRHSRTLQRWGYELTLEARPPATYVDLSKFGAVNVVRRDRATGVLEGVGDPRRNGAAAGP